jgi:hypothetical protein
MSALAIAHKQATAWRSPSYTSATISSVDTADGAAAKVSVTVTLADVGKAGLTTDVYPYNYEAIHGNCSALDNAFVLENLMETGGQQQQQQQSASTTLVAPGTCGWAAIKIEGRWVNATTVSATASGKLVLTASAPGGGVPTATSYGWAPIPLMNAYDISTGLPVLPWNRSL